MRVLKFGGTSLAHPHRLDVVARRIQEAHAEGPVVVVVSALGGVTDRLTEALEAARRGEPTPGLTRQLRALHLDDPEKRLSVDAKRQLEQQLDYWLRQLDQLLEGIAQLGEAPAGALHRVLATGERLSAPRVAAWLQASKLPAVVVDGKSLVRTDCDLDSSGAASPRIDAAATRRSVLESLGGLVRGEVPVVTGFIGGDVRGRTVTLGRGASDLSATTLAAAFGADAVEIWSDTDGVLSADPRRVPSAVPLRRLSFAQASALARYGAKVLHPETLEPVRRASLPVHLRSTFQPDAPGTRLDVGGLPSRDVQSGGPQDDPGESDAQFGEWDGAEEDAVQQTAAVAVTRLDVEHVEARSAPSIPLASQTLAVLERAGVTPLSLSCAPGRVSLWLRRADAALVRGDLRRELRPLGGAVEPGGVKTAVAVLPRGGEATALLADFVQCLSAHGLAIEALFTDRGQGSGAFRDDPAGPELAVAVLDSAVADLAVRTAHDVLVAPQPEARRLEVAAAG